MRKKLESVSVNCCMYGNKNLIWMLYSSHKYRIFITVIQLGSLKTFYKYTATNYATLCNEYDA
jgi:hypothetical protein